MLWDNWGDNWKTSLDKSEVSLPKLPIVQIALEIVKSKSDPIRILSKSKSGNQHRATQATQAINTKQHHGNFQYWSFTDIALNTRRTNNNTCGSCPAMSSSLKTHLTKTVTFWPDVYAAYFEATCSYVRLTTMPSLGLFQLLNNVRPALYKPTRFLQYHTIPHNNNTQPALYLTLPSTSVASGSLKCHKNRPHTIYCSWECFAHLCLQLWKLLLNRWNLHKPQTNLILHRWKLIFSTIYILC